MFIHYKKTHLEHFVEQIYIDHHIQIPEDITIEKLSTELNIYVEYAPIRSRAYESNSGIRCILLDNRITPMKQRFEFLHELCHILRHAGNQMVLPSPFIKAQEEDAEKFLLYATMPFFMIQPGALSDEYDVAIHQLSSIFGVSKDMAKKRFDQILRREYEGELIPDAGGRQLSRRKNAEPNQDNYETKIFAYYDPHSTLDGPDQLIVCLDQKTLLSQHEWVVPVEERFQEIDLESLKNIEIESATRGDLICFDGQLTLQIHQLVYKYGLSKRNFVLQMRDIEQILEADQSSVRKFL
ncbi:ImmA/IrrE family metallo-endopeptidase [Paenibacillus riograndensis]|uniref:IrrE N-terminal-like domain-containing protein n=1 Tax=Paenibacillus riograndensis SBR5 TaxID=1073571 RepID=A0A0E3WJA6_9BACL|nr:ImmA/IrrE family metallo-endopeptidase [Paenibacillus riograndensis]CQR58453.1 hypothetical protein PRIO_6102 [Paenibacillus riograndensis SBR5]